MDEAQFVDYLKTHFPMTRGKGIGDDTSAVKTGDRYQLITKDLFMEGVHFSLDYYTLEEVAIKAMAVNLSDIAAMGGDAGYFYLGIGWPRKLGPEGLNRFFQGLERGCQRWGVELAGGDYSAAEHLYISVTMVGEAAHPVFRDGARASDLIGLTGPVGDSAAGLRLLLEGEREHPLCRAHINACPQLAKGRILAGNATAMMDVSDGLLIDLKRLLTASGKGARVHYEDIPVSEELRTLCREKQWDEYRTVLAGGEDYVLLFTFPPSREKQLKQAGLKYSVIGGITGSPGGVSVTHHGEPVCVGSDGYDHFQ